VQWTLCTLSPRKRPSASVPAGLGPLGQKEPRRSSPAGEGRGQGAPWLGGVWLESASSASLRSRALPRCPRGAKEVNLGPGAGQPQGRESTDGVPPVAVGRCSAGAGPAGVHHGEGDIAL
jgi:hypothetical protein